MATRLGGHARIRLDRRRRRRLARGQPPTLLLLAPLLIRPRPRGVLSNALLLKALALCLELGLALGRLRRLLLWALGLGGLLAASHALVRLRMPLSLLAPRMPARELVSAVGPAHDHQRGRAEEWPGARPAPRSALRPGAAVEDNSGACASASHRCSERAVPFRFE